MIHRFTVEIESNDSEYKVNRVLQAQLEDLANEDDEYYDSVSVHYEGTKY